MNAYSTLRDGPLRLWLRNATVKAIAHTSDLKVTEVATKLYGHEGADQVLKAAVDPASTGGWGGQLAAGVRVAEFLRSLRGRSAAAELFDRGLRVDLSGVGSATLPGLSADYPEPSWVAEGAPIPAHEGNLAGPTLTPKKLAAIGGLTGELADLAAEDAEAIVADIMRDAAAKALDASLFSNTAASAVRPAGILNGIAATAATAGGGIDALTGDVRNLVGAIAAAGGGSSVMFFAAPQQAAAMKLLAGGGFDYPVISAPSLAAGTVIAIEARAFASGFGDVPRVDIGKEATIVWDDAAGPVSTAGTPNVVAAPLRSGFQENTWAIRLVLRAAWGLRAPMVAWLDGSATW